MVMPRDEAGGVEALNLDSVSLLCHQTALQNRQRLFLFSTSKN
jgi:hypothetical protein